MKVDQTLGNIYMLVLITSRICRDGRRKYDRRSPIEARRRDPAHRRGSKSRAKAPCIIGTAGSRLSSIRGHVRWPLRRRSSAHSNRPTSGTAPTRRRRSDHYHLQNHTHASSGSQSCHNPNPARRYRGCLSQIRLRGRSESLGNYMDCSINTRHERCRL